MLLRKNSYTVRRTLILIFFLAIRFPVMAQEDFYDAGVIQDIRIIFHEKNWKHVMDSVFKASKGEDRWICDIRINGQLYENVGIRYKGYSSVNLEDRKNPFNIDLAYTLNNKNYKGFTSLRLSNVNYDPSFVREALSYEIARKYMPASRANFANVYINDTLLGLYSNVEAVNKKFILRFFPGNDNSFIKGSPANLKYPFGQNANLADTHGTDSTGYIPYYELESDWGWSDLFHFIIVLNQQSDSVSQVLNVDRALWMHAFNYTLLNLDSYIGYSQNYYMYKNDKGIFNTIPWDMNMSFGSFRHTDGSYHYTGLTIPQTEQLNPLGLLDFAVSPRPLVTKLLKNDTLKRMFLAHMRTIITENISNNEYFTRGQFMQGVIDSAVKNDLNKFYSYEYFHENLLNTVGSSGSENEFPGIKEIMEARVAYLDTLDGFAGQPVISEITHAPEIPVRNEPCWITARIQGSIRAMLGFRFTTGETFSRIAMIDDGNHHDGISGDGIFGAMITTAGHTIQYYIYAENDSSGTFAPERAEYEFYSIQPMIMPGDIVLNEFYAGAGNESWIELLNTTTESLDLSGMQLSDEPSFPAKWVLPDTIIQAKKYLLIDPPENPTTRKPASLLTLTPSGGNLLLTNESGVILDSVGYGLQPTNRSTGRYPNGYGPMTFMIPTKGSYNGIGTTPGTGFLIYPNPSQGLVSIETLYDASPVTVIFYNSTGNVMFEGTYQNEKGRIGSAVFPVDVSGLNRGLYLVKVVCNEKTSTKKLILY